MDRLPLGVWCPVEAPKPQPLFDVQYASSIDLVSAVVVCTQVVLEMGSRQEEVVLHNYPQLCGHVLSMIKAPTTSANVLPQSVAFNILVIVMR